MNAIHQNMDSQKELPKTHRALILNSTKEPPEVKVLATPQPTPGSAIVRILAANVLSYARDIYNGSRHYPFPTRLVVGASAIGRIAAVGPDATTLSPGQLVHVDCTIRGRDDATSTFLSGIHEGFSDGSKRLMHGEWKDSTYAEYCKVPLENCNPLNEGRLLGSVKHGGLGYDVEDLAYLSALLVPYGGLRDIGVKAGETIIISPATGAFGGAAVLMALALGARVIALGRNLEILRSLSTKSDRVEIVQISGDEGKDAMALQSFGPVDAFFDISPPIATGSTHIKSAILALKHAGRISLMGGIRSDVSISYSVVVHKDLQLKGKWMYPREAIRELIKMVEVGILKLGDSAGAKVVGKFGLEDWDKAFTAAADNAGMGMQALITP